MEKYRVTIQRVSYSKFQNIDVEAKDWEEAKAKALSKAGDLVFTEMDADYLEADIRILKD